MDATPLFGVLVPEEISQVEDFRDRVHESTLVESTPSPHHSMLIEKFETLVLRSAFSDQNFASAVSVFEDNIVLRGHGGVNSRLAHAMARR